METEDKLFNLISRVNQSLPYFETNFTSAIRIPGTSEKERCTSFEQYVEIRFNYEFFNEFPEIQNIMMASGGTVFKCILLEDVDLSRRRFKTAHVKLELPDETLFSSEQILIDELKKLPELIGGTLIKFNNVKKKIKYFIE